MLRIGDLSTLEVQWIILRKPWTGFAWFAAKITEFGRPLVAKVKRKAGYEK